MAELPLAAVLLALSVLMAVQVRMPRPNGRTRMIPARETPPRSDLHLAHIPLEGVKVVLLVMLGVLLVLRLPA